MLCYGRIAQLVEQRPFKPTVGGSNPSAPTQNQEKNPEGFFDFMWAQRDLKDAGATLRASEQLKIMRRVRAEST